MKILLLFFGLLFSGGLFANMDEVCKTRFNKLDFIEKRCERNNILYITDIPKRQINAMIAMWCRHDRQINYTVEINPNEIALTCVLYSNEPRTSA